jgi:hypothetical protein
LIIVDVSRLLCFILQIILLGWYLAIFLLFLCSKATVKASLARGENRHGAVLGRKAAREGKSGPFNHSDAWLVIFASCHSEAKPENLKALGKSERRIDPACLPQPAGWQGQTGLPAAAGASYSGGGH